jgi:hypothetical protein
MQRNYGSGVSWYSTVWPLFTAPVGAAQAGLAATWLYPRSFLTNKADLFGSPQEKALYQSIEGSLGWWGDTAYRSPLPKYQPGATINSFRTGARDFWAGQPIPQGGGGWITLSNQILLPPEGMTFDPVSSGGQLGQSWFALPLPKTGAALPFKAGPNAWTLFLNAANFKGPIAYIEPNFWAESVAAFPALAGLTFDNQFATSYLISGEFAAIPFYQITDQSGVVYAKIPPLQFPTDAGGRFRTEAFTISVTNVNEAPSLTSGNSGSVAENAAISTVMVLVTTLMFVLVQVVGRGNNEAQGDAR